jgi:hypothetical protein
MVPARHVTSRLSGEGVLNRKCCQFRPFRSHLRVTPRARLLQPTSTKAQITKGLSLSLDGKREVTSLLIEPQTDVYYLPLTAPGAIVMDQVEVTVSFVWIHIGSVYIDDKQRVKFPNTEKRPGLYRFEIIADDSKYQYIGETDNLFRRMNNYRAPGSGQATNIRLNAKLIESLTAGCQVSLSVMFEGPTASCGSFEQHVDLALKSERILLESAAIFTARAAGVPTLNL